MGYVYDDGGQRELGLKGDRYCAVRAVAIACEIDFAEARQRLKKAAKTGKAGSAAISRGMLASDISAALKELGWTWCKAPTFEGRKARASDLPPGRHVASMAKHVAAVVDGEVHDAFDSSEKMVYGYWAKR